MDVLTNKEFDQFYEMNANVMWLQLVRRISFIVDSFQFFINFNSVCHTVWL